MRFDKFTTKFQQALADAQSMALGQDHPYIEPQHLLLALMQQEDGSIASLLQRAGVNVQPLRQALTQSLKLLRITYRLCQCQQTRQGETSYHVDER